MFGHVQRVSASPAVPAALNSSNPRHHLFYHIIWEIASVPWPALSQVNPTKLRESWTVFLASLDESATKQSVVLRLLSLCGWDPFDPAQVVSEYTVGNRRVDFALRPGSANAVFIEVKPPSESLENHQQQLLEHCFQEGVKLAALTNGRTWWLYLPLQSGSWDQ